MGTIKPEDVLNQVVIECVLLFIAFTLGYVIRVLANIKSLDAAELKNSNLEEENRVLSRKLAEALQDKNSSSQVSVC